VDQVSVVPLESQGLVCPSATSNSSDSIQTMALFLDELTLFDRINLASCAQRRAEMNVINDDRFTSEFKTAKMWTKYRCVITTHSSYIDD
jgi:hypothetical protein